MCDVCELTSVNCIAAGSELVGSKSAIATAMPIVVDFGPAAPAFGIQRSDERGMSIPSPQWESHPNDRPTYSRSPQTLLVFGVSDRGDIRPYIREIDAFRIHLIFIVTIFSQ